jgi:hypothetical protein
VNCDLLGVYLHKILVVGISIDLAQNNKNENKIYNIHFFYKMFLPEELWVTTISKNLTLNELSKIIQSCKQKLFNLVNILNLF